MFEAMKQVAAIERLPYTPANGAQYPAGRLAAGLQQIARLIKADAGLEVAFTEAGGWDTHVNQAPQLNARLAELGQSLAAFAADLGGRLGDVALVTMSEFGRTARENGNRGTDHGHANCMFVLGGGFKGGRVAGRWPGLRPEQLYEGRDLAVTTDFRQVLGELVSRHMGARELASVFPGFQPADKNILELA
jgi:uncharacterized protein (DUF1501 family)